MEISPKSDPTCRCAEHDQASASESRAPTSESSAVLIVENDPEQSHTLQTLLEREGFQVVCRQTGQEAMASFRTRDFPVAVLANRPPDADAVSLLQQMLFYNDKTRIIIYSDNGAFASARNATDLGAFAYFEKGCDPLDLVRAVHRGKLAYAAANAHDLETRMAHRDMLLNESETRLRAIIDSVVDGLILISDAGIMETFNPAAERIFGYAEREVIGKNVSLLMGSADDQKHHDAHLKRYLNTGERRIIGIGREVTGKRKDGSVFPMDLAVGELNLPDRRMFVGILRDITERKHLESQFLQAQKMDAVGRLAGGVAHDFNNILTAIFGYADLTINQLPANHQLREYLDEIIKAATRATTLTRQLLTFSRKEMNNPQDLELNRLVLGMEKMFRRVIGHHIELRTELNDEPIWVNANPGHLEQVILNLIVNARDAMPKGGALIIRTAGGKAALNGLTNQNVAILEVSDTGCGIDPKIQAHIFEPFFSTKGPDHGTGLGLSTVEKIVNHYQGRIDLQSVPDKGTTFTILIPSVIPPHLAFETELDANANLNASRPNTNNNHHKNPKNRKPAAPVILLAEDNDSLRELSVKILTNAGYHVLSGRNGHEALAVNQRHIGPIHLLIANVDMPVIHGFQLAETIVLHRPDIRILMISGYPDDILLSNLDKNGNPYPFLPKPFDPPALLERVRDILEIPADSHAHSPAQSQNP